MGKSNPLSLFRVGGVGIPRKEEEGEGGEIVAQLTPLLRGELRAGGRSPKKMSGRGKEGREGPSEANNR